MNKLFTILALSFAMTNAYAHGPSPMKTDEAIIINAPAAKVWAIAGNFSAPQSWVTGVKSVKLDKRNNEDYRIITTVGGKTITDKLHHKKEQDMELKYEFIEGALPVTNYNIKITVKDLGAGKSEARWFARYYRLYAMNPPIPAGQDDASAKAAIDALVKTSLANLKVVAEKK